MFRIVRSTTEPLDIPTAQEDAYDAAVEAGDTYRETLGHGEDDRSAYRLIGYTDPNGQERWAVTADEAVEVHWQDTEDLAEAIAQYETLVRDTADGMGDEYEEREDEETGQMVAGNLKDPFESTDVPGIRGYEDGAEEAGNSRAWMTEASRKDAADKAVQEAATASTQARQIAIARAVDTYGRGGQAILARRLSLSEPTVKQLADRGRALLAEGDQPA
ncbi:hypothetical protein ACFV0B_11595 [Streptomyces xanthophaeus]|uniref:hypothetical protein n=1 Tax=Streptomyces xanthophaeus TaxID=67385 RepID=UPI003693DAAD